jgi:hypothetical protein
MPILNRTIQMATQPLPKMISPKAHAMFDFLVAGSFFLMAPFLWRRSKRAAVAALLSGGAELAVSLLTNYPGGARRVIHPRTHRDIDYGLAAMIATMPEFLAFEDDNERKLFLTQGALITAVNGLTDFPGRPYRAERRTAA